MTYSKRIFFLLSVFALFISCKESEQENSAEDLAKIKSLINRMEVGGGELASQIDSIAHFYQNILDRKDSIMSLNLANPYTYNGAFSENIPGEDSALSSIIILNTTPDRIEAEQEVILTNSLDSAFAAFMKKNPLAVQIYSNSAKQVSRVFPSYDSKNMVDPDIDVTTFNFYYEADSAHNPNRGLVWISDAYVDPAGKGWILSILHPIYDGDRLFAVLGVDYTITKLIENYLDSEDGEYVLVNQKGDIVAGKADAIEGLSLPPLKNHVYRETVQSDNFRISEFNLFNSKSREVREMAQTFLFQKENLFEFKLEPNLKKAVCMPFPSIDWYLIEVFPNY
ncbi:PDC sensor domain-containing protein [Algoriphagus litoralis]|uniref:PDC sensor domain-containing protein n=1 Tax=Algoriphagus litoralis TaxID=2202829 RepID=UPI000DBAAA88|nr:cache domain-containing protein [Algoriphagus litoralis]